MEEIVQIENVNFEYAQQDAEDEVTVAVHDATIRVREGEMLAVIGHNGSGKSTVAKLINALLLPTTGKVYVLGMDTAEEPLLWEIRQTAGMVFQNPDNQIIATIVEEDVAFGLENLGTPPPEIRRRVQEALELVGMTDYAQSAPHMLSGGQKQRIAIAGLIAMRPKVLVFDESTAMLDPKGRQEVLETVMRLNREEGMTVIWITHFMQEATLCHRVVVMDEGRVLRTGSPREVFTHMEELKQVGLDVPPMMELAALLKVEGLPIAQDIISVEEMVDALCQLK